MSEIYIYQHLGLGDFISCNGLIRSLLKKFKNEDIINIFVPNNYEEMISFMYRDESRIKAIPIYIDKNKIKGKSFRKKDIDKMNKESNEVKKYLKSRKDKNYKFIKIGYEFYGPTSDLNNEKNIPWTADIIFYKQMNIPYENRYSKCYWKRDKYSEERVYNNLVKNKSKPFAFIHDEPNRGYFIKDKNVTPDLQIVKNNSNESIFNFGLVLERASEIHVMESSFRCMLETLDTTKAKHYLYSFNDGPWKSIPYYLKDKDTFIGTSKKWMIKDLKFENKNKNILNRIFNFKFY